MNPHLNVFKYIIIVNRISLIYYIKLNLNYKKGFRLFELDIVESSDYIYVAAHDWKHWKSITGYTGVLPPTRVEFKPPKI